MAFTGMTSRAAGLFVAALVTAGSLAGCGSASSTTAQDPGAGTSTPTSVPSSSSGQTAQTPTCLRVWKQGATLPHSYRGCATTAGWVKAQVYQCSDGHHLVTYAHAFYASPGRTISRAATTLAKDHGFQQTMAVCGA